MRVATARDVSSRGSHRHAIAAALLAGCLAAGLSGCGWQPLYSRPSADPASGGVGAKLAQIAVDPVESRAVIAPLRGVGNSVYDAHTAQTLQNSLLSGLNPYGRPSQPLYHLAVELQQQISGSSATANGQSTRDDVTMTARFKLLDEKGNAVLTDQAKAITSFDILYEPYADVASRNDALQRGAEQLAAAIQSRLAAFLLNTPTAAR
jgi:LPS-assembly lipoprotein